MDMLSYSLKSYKHAIKDMWKEPKSSDIQSKNGQGLLEAECYSGLYEEDGGD